MPERVTAASTRVPPVRAEGRPERLGEDLAGGAGPTVQRQHGEDGARDEPETDPTCGAVRPAPRRASLRVVRDTRRAGAPQRGAGREEGHRRARVRHNGGCGGRSEGRHGPLGVRGPRRPRVAARRRVPGTGAGAPPLGRGAPGGRGPDPRGGTRRGRRHHRPGARRGRRVRAVDGRGVRPEHPPGRVGGPRAVPAPARDRRRPARHPRLLRARPRRAPPRAHDGRAAERLPGRLARHVAPHLGGQRLLRPRARTASSGSPRPSSSTSSSSRPPRSRATRTSRA